MVLYDPHVKLDDEEARKLRERLDNPPSNPRAVDALRRGRANQNR